MDLHYLRTTSYDCNNDKVLFQLFISLYFCGFILPIIKGLPAIT